MLVATRIWKRIMVCRKGIIRRPATLMPATVEIAIPTPEMVEAILMDILHLLIVIPTVITMAAVETEIGIPMPVTTEISIRMI